MGFQSTLPSQGATFSQPPPEYPLSISIHAPLTGSDVQNDKQVVFLYNFNPRSPHRERHFIMTYVSYHSSISIHAPLTGSDRIPPLLNHHFIEFQSTLPSQGATNEGPLYVRGFRISIHAPLTGSDSSKFIQFSEINDFNPRSPHRERLLCLIVISRISVFQSTLPSQGATAGGNSQEIRSINFNPRSPHRERRAVKLKAAIDNRFQSTLPPQGATLVKRFRLSSMLNFNPRSPHRERRCSLYVYLFPETFQSTLPSQGATGMLIMWHFVHEFQSTLPSQGATRSTTIYRR